MPASQCLAWIRRCIQPTETIFYHKEVSNNLYLVQTHQITVRLSLYLHTQVTTTSPRAHQTFQILSNIIINSSSSDITITQYQTLLSHSISHCIRIKHLIIRHLLHHQSNIIITHYPDHQTLLLYQTSSSEHYYYYYLTIIKLPCHQQLKNAFFCCSSMQYQLCLLETTSMLISPPLCLLTSQVLTSPNSCSAEITHFIGL